MNARIWHMNADFELELAAWPGQYQPHQKVARINRGLAAHLLWLATPGDALLIDRPWSKEIIEQAARHDVELISDDCAERQIGRVFTPWGWTRSAIELGQRLGAIVEPLPIATVARVNSKLFSHNLEVELGIAMPGASVAATFEELQAAVAAACARPDDKWVIKSPMGWAARERVLGRGPLLADAAAIWCRRRFLQGEQLIFQPWLEVRREYGVQIFISADGAINFLGVSDLQTNGAGAGKGYLFGRKIDPLRLTELKNMADIVGARLFKAGYYGPAGFDALEHAGGLHPLLEINARYTMGFVALAVESSMNISEPIFWSIKGGAQTSIGYN